MAEWEDFCGCCGNNCGRGQQWCSRCATSKHLGRADRPPWERTWFAQRGEDCPFQVQPEGADSA